MPKFWKVFVHHQRPHLLSAGRSTSDFRDSASMLRDEDSYYLCLWRKQLKLREGQHLAQGHTAVVPESGFKCLIQISPSES